MVVQKQGGWTSAAVQTNIGVAWAKWGEDGVFSANHNDWKKGCCHAPCSKFKSGD